MNNVITNANGVKVKVRVYDIGDGEIDRYTYRRHSYDFGKRVKDLASLPEEVIKYIKIITT